MFQGCTPTLTANWATLKIDYTKNNTYIVTFTAGTPTSSASVTFDTRGLRTTAVCRVDFVLIDHCECVLESAGVWGPGLAPVFCPCGFGFRSC